MYFDSQECVDPLADSAANRNLRTYVDKSDPEFNALLIGALRGVLSAIWIKRDVNGVSLVNQLADQANEVSQVAFVGDREEYGSRAARFGNHSEVDGDVSGQVSNLESASKFNSRTTSCPCSPTDCRSSASGNFCI